MEVLVLYTHLSRKKKKKKKRSISEVISHDYPDLIETEEEGGEEWKRSASRDPQPNSSPE